ncbi:MAG: DUF3887 domain-containing protein [Cyanobacteriota bacterium]|nr:DUF3887 domain-containing protein [Cyanobacteriota bacterium]
MRPVLPRFGVIALALGALASTAPLGAARALELAQTPEAVTAPAARPTSAAAVELRARQAAEDILKAMRDGDAKTRYAQFAPDLQRMTSPWLVEMNMRRQPKVRGWRITAVIPGMESSTVEATLQTSAGERSLLMVIDENGLLAGYHFNVADQPAEKVVRDFMDALTNGRFVLASSFLSQELQEEVSAAGLQRKWQLLQRRTGNFLKVRRIARSESTADMKLLLVNTQFTRTTDNLFVILDNKNQIVGVDFPTDARIASPANQP